MLSHKSPPELNCVRFKVDGTSGDHMLIAPPYIVTEAELEFLVDTLGKALDTGLLAYRK